MGFLTGLAVDYVAIMEYGFCYFSCMAKVGTIALLLLVTAVAGCAKIQEPEFRRIDQFRIKTASFTSATIGLNVTYFNPNNFSMSVKETGADVYLDNVYVGRFAQDTTVTVGNAQEFSIPLSGTVSVDKLLQLDIQNIGSRDVDVRAEGSTKVGKAGVFITKPFSYEGKHRLDEVKL